MRACAVCGPSGRWPLASSPAAWLAYLAFLCPRSVRGGIKPQRRPPHSRHAMRLRIAASQHCITKTSAASPASNLHHLHQTCITASNLHHLHHTCITCIKPASPASHLHHLNHTCITCITPAPHRAIPVVPPLVIDRHFGLLLCMLLYSPKGL